MELRQPKTCSLVLAFLLYSLLILIPTTYTSVSATYSGNETDRLALLSFKSMITHDPYGVLSSWNASSDFCDWIGITCGKRHRRLTIIQLVSQGLEGSLSPHVGNLSFLHELELLNNSFQGIIPHELGHLTRLRYLSLVHNNFNGVIPTNLSRCSNLFYLNLGDNHLIGNIPKEISLLSKLKYLYMYSTNLTGGIPSFLGNLTSMELFSVTKTPLGGNIPDTFGSWKRLVGFFAGGCQLVGTIPRSIYNLSLLTNLSLSGNQLTGNLPLEIGTRLPNLKFLQLRNNQLSGILPPSISNCSNLQILEMSDNKFNGKLIIDFAKLSDLKTILIGNNNYEEDDQMKFMNSLQNCSKLKTLDLRYCNLQGVLPRSIGNFSQQLKFLALLGNRLYGNLPPSLGNLVSMSTLDLNKNRFTGQIPSTVGRLHSLQVLSLFRNQLSGSIPDSVGNLSMIISLNLDSNRLEGRVPSSLGNCHNLLQLYLGNNKLNGEIPKTLLQLPSLSISLNLSHNLLLGSIPYEVGDLKRLNYLDLSYNNLSGDIPSTLGSCTALMFLYLQGNLLQGTLSPWLSSLRGLQVIDLSQNNLSGQIPLFLEGFSFEFVNMSDNYFEGEVPTNGTFSNAGAFSIKGNTRVCGGLVELGLPKCRETNKHARKFSLFVIVILAASSFTFIIILCIVYILRKNKSNLRVSSSSMNGQLSRVSYNQLLKATSGFSISNLIGEGGYSSVYKGIIENDDRFVAIKVLHLQVRGAYISFTRECEAWRSIRHRNLLKIITSCSGVDFRGNDFKALVYEFMPNGSLYDWLHSSASTSRLNLIQRIKVLIDVASALDYLHNECPKTIVHCDLKSSNVLLDDDMVAHVGDFGLARFIGEDSYQNNSTGFKGTIGYAPPEYGLGSEMTSSGDVYSFGILLLELMTGKKPTDDMFNEDFSLHKYVDMALPYHVVDVIDNDIIVTQSTEVNALKVEECLVSTMKIGVTCSMDFPPQRMNIKDVVQELQCILDTLQKIRGNLLSPFINTATKSPS
ncbi:LRR receptor-like serine/threonine-protein kinase EFR [Rutidosis leptorrhynchoides]|uniref:LRR receptor-like serine/threonine-protein kinase EFR n=1 Tax=Rutidosis leptorrhynchoides TaxID=125765 RepID=UPI003A9A32BE